MVSEQNTRSYQRGIRAANRFILLGSLVGLTAIAIRAAAKTKPASTMIVATAPEAVAPIVSGHEKRRSPKQPASKQAASKQPASKSRSIIGGLTFLTVTVTLSLLATSGSYALWNGKVGVNGQNLGTGSIGLTVNTVAAYTLSLPTTSLAPGKSVLATATVKNTGSVPISAAVATTTITSNTNGLAASLSLTVTPVSAVGNCAAGLGGGTTAALTSFSTTSAPYAMPAGASQIVCFELRLDDTAPASAQGGGTTFRLNLVASQTRP